MICINGEKIQKNKIKLSSFLEENGIQCMLTNENVAAVYPIPNIGEIRILVFESDFDRAHALLDEAGTLPK